MRLSSPPLRLMAAISGTALVGCSLGSPSTGTLQASPGGEADALTAPVSILGEFCEALSSESVITAYRRGQELLTIDASDVVVDGGSRVLKTFSIDDCGAGRGRVTFRFTEDVGGGLSGSELFIKDETTKEVVGVALGADGSELAVVPPELAFDKSSNKADSTDTAIRTRTGCFACHANVSLDYDMPGAAAFWNDAKLTAAFIPADLPADETPVPTTDPASPNFKEPLIPSGPEQPIDEGLFPEDGFGDPSLIADPPA